MALPKPDDATKNVKRVGYSDQDGRCDGVQIMVDQDFAYYVGHSVVDVRDPKQSKTVKSVAAPPPLRRRLPFSLRIGRCKGRR